MEFNLFGMFSLVEWLIFAFIGMNMSIAATCLLERGVKRLSSTRD